MAWRFTPSKYKNTTPKVPKKEETIYDLPVGNLSCTNNAIHSSDHNLAFLIDGEGGKIGLLPLEARGRFLHHQTNIVYAHATSISDFCFTEFENLLVTCAGTEKMKIWQCSDVLKQTDDKPVHISDAISAITLGNNVLLECLSPHKTVSKLIAVGSSDAIFVVDLENEANIIELNADYDRVQSLNWSDSGSLLTASAKKGREGYIFDPRASSDPVQTLVLHSGMGREGRILFTNEGIVSSGFTNNRVQEVLLFDPRNWTQPIQKEIFEPSTGLLIPLYDRDTGLLFLAGKGSSKFTLTEINSSKWTLTRLQEQPVSEQTLGACLIRKMSCDVMTGEVQRIHQLTKNSIIPYQMCVPRRSYKDFHSDLYPLTVDSSTATTKGWLSGENVEPSKVSLNPNNAHISNAESNGHVGEPVSRTSDLSANTTGEDSNTPRKIHYQDVLVKNDSPAEENVSPNPHNGTTNKESITSKIPVNGNPTEVRSCENVAPIPVKMRAPPKSIPTAILQERKIRPKSCVAGTIQSKFRHVEASVATKKDTFTNLRNLNNRMPMEANPFAVSEKYAAVPLQGTAGSLAIFELSDPVKVPDGIIDAIQNGSPITDFQFNPFADRSNELAVALENGTLKLWEINDQIPCIGAPKTEEETAEENSEPAAPKLADLSPMKVIDVGNGKKITCLRYNPVAKGIICVGLANGVMAVWNLLEEKCILEIPAHTSGVLSLAWSTDGKRVATVGRDFMLRIFEPQDGIDCCVSEKKVLESSRGARVCFVCQDELLLLTSFSKTSSRQCSLYQLDGLNLLHNEIIDVGTSMIVPHFDYDTSVLFLTGKGDRTRVSFKVPRIKKDMFQRDVFPNALITWKPSLTGTEWETNTATNLQFCDLCPVGTKEFDNAVRAQAELGKTNAEPKVEGTVQNPKASLNPQHTNKESPIEEADLKLKTEKGWSERIHKDDGALEQDHVEGVAESEWTE
ncbi:type of WD40 repeat domain-containing protein [Ditylenchus destructor]|uniref:Coronin n=1 Tax=Ditylenchus destructor TaxID=166010 RepID=A0AAD4NBK5_9BILA|nr:type of WD40 repeat domain-containing protein [Ditylenchus destructor]